MNIFIKKYLIISTKYNNFCCLNVYYYKYVSPILLPNHVSPLYSIEVFDILQQEKELIDTPQIKRES